MYLQKVLNRELTNHIRESLPILRETLLVSNRIQTEFHSIEYN